MRIGTIVISAACAAAAFVFAGCGPAVALPALEQVSRAETESETPADGEIRFAMQLVERLPQYPSSHLKLAAAYLQKVRESGDYSFNRNAEVSIKKALELDKESLTAQLLRLQILLSEHSFKEALTLSEEVLESAPDNPAAMAARTDALTELGRFEEAIRSAQEFVNKRPNAASYTRVAHLRSLHGETEAAIEARIQALQMADPSNRETYAWFIYRLGNEHLIAGDLERAERAFRRSLEVFPGYHWASEGLGKVLAKRGNLDAAAAIFESLLAKAHEPGRAIFLGDIYSRLGRKEDADRTYREAEKKERAKDGPDLHRIALFWADNDSNLAEALEIARLDSEENDDLAASDTYAWALYKDGDPAEARKLMKRAMRTGVRNPLYLYHLGMIEKALGNRTRAKDLLNEAIGIDPEFDLIQAAKARSALEEMES